MIKRDRFQSRSKDYWFLCWWLTVFNSNSTRCLSCGVQQTMKKCWYWRKVEEKTLETISAFLFNSFISQRWSCAFAGRNNHSRNQKLLMFPLFFWISPALSEKLIKRRNCILCILKFFYYLFLPFLDEYSMLVLCSWRFMALLKWYDTVISEIFVWLAFYDFPKNSQSIHLWFSRIKSVSLCRQTLNVFSRFCYIAID